jgi:LPPG:FO 2-phospho-L-lactate transferase
MSDDRVETHVAIDDPGAVGQRVGALPGVLGAAARRGPGPSRRAVGLDGATPAPACSRRSPTPTCDRAAVQPGGLRRHHPRRAGVREALRATGARWSASPPSSAAPRARDGRPAAHRDRRRGLAAGGGPSTTAPGAPAACSTAGWSTPPTPATWTGCAPAGIACRAVPLMMTDHDATAAMAAAAFELVTTTMTGAPGGSPRHLAARTASARSRSGTDLAAPAHRRRRSRRTATSSA